MADITLTNTFAAGVDATLGAKIMANFTDITDVLNGSLDEDNIVATAQPSIQKITASTVLVTPLVQSEANADLYIDIDVVASGAKLKITDSDDTVLFQILETGGVQIGA